MARRFGLSHSLGSPILQKHSLRMLPASNRSVSNS
jgi:hypothetical protein